MKNLAGIETCDSDIVRELLEAKIGIIPQDRSNHEVTASFYGELCGWKFHRAWYYWMASPIEDGCGLPLELAKLLHKTHGKDVRVTGHCGAPPPEEWVERYTYDGRTVVVDPDGKERESFDHLNKLTFMDYNLEDYVFVKDPSEVNHISVVPNYHIDTQEGLNAFVLTLRQSV
tara:strand:- start:3459 stop:3977 length:519 start_codon:yes stop_codon:yes gene_type:complete